MKDYNSNKGFTLVEMMVATVVLLIILAAIFMVLSTGRNTWWASTTRIELNQELRKAEEWISKELRQGRSDVDAVSITGDYNEKISFQIPSSVSDAGVITWQGIEYYLSGNQIIRKDSTTKVLANNINSLTFTKDLPKITVSIAARKEERGRTTNVSINFYVKLRN